MFLSMTGTLDPINAREVPSHLMHANMANVIVHFNGYIEYRQADESASHQARRPAY
jgi:hypothetical protein